MEFEPRAYRLVANAAVPNNSWCPLLVYPAAENRPEPDLANHFERLFARHGWCGAWRNGIFAMHHWHNNAHEVLGIYSGDARVQFGGEGGPVIEAATGDVMVVPAGVAHKRLGGARNLGVVGAYAGGRRPDMCTPAQAIEGLRETVDAVPLPTGDPVYGAGGPLFDHWRAPGSR